MNTTRQTGRQGEQAAVDWLFANGYNVVKRNYLCPGGEIDIIAETKEYIIFVEVKFRMDQPYKEKYGRPGLKVNESKKTHLQIAAGNYLAQSGARKKPRFDVIEITGDDKLVPGFVVLEITHTPNAFRW